jgi:hypothetical protein
MRSIIIFAIAVLLFTGCNDDVEKPNLAYPGAFKMTLDGEEMRSNADSSFTAMRDIGWTIFGTRFVTKNDTIELVFNFMDSTMRGGKSELYGFENFVGAFVRQVSVDRKRDGGPEYYNVVSNGDVLGEINITKYDSIKKLMSGNFEFELSNHQQQIKITNGSFTDIATAE